MWTRRQNRDRFIALCSAIVTYLVIVVSALILAFYGYQAIKKGQTCLEKTGVWLCEIVATDSGAVYKPQ